MRSIIAVIKLLTFLLWCALIVPPQMICNVFCKGNAVYFLPWVWHKGMCFVFKLKVETHGKICTERPVLFVSNHISYLDIPVIGSTLKASFIAKSEVASWPLFGLLAKLQNTAFIDRRRSASVREAGSLEKLLEKEGGLILFPEGTSHTGELALPFRSNFFQIAVGHENLPIQPISIQILKVDKKPADSQPVRDIYAWYGDMDMAPHLWAFAKSRGAVIKLTFHEPLRVKPNQNRKTLAKLAGKPVHKAFQSA